MASKLNYCKGVVICHGKSELCLVKYITTNLHLNIKTYAHEKGKSSIQITKLPDILKSGPFRSLSAFASEYSVATSGKGAQKKLEDFKLFILMDTDDCTAAQKEQYIRAKLFEGHWLQPYIVPIYSLDSLEDVMVDAGIMTRRIKTDEKGSYYEQIFPINTKPLSDDTLAEVTTLRSRLVKSKKSNLVQFIDYCLSLLPGQTPG